MAEISFTIPRSEINKAVGDMSKLLKKLSDTELKNSWLVGAKISERAIKNAAPVLSGKRSVKRYNTPKALGRLRAPKGQGKVVAEYYAGNLKRAMRILNLRRAKGVYIGAYSRGKKDGRFSGARADGYYLHMIERGTKHTAPRPFIGAAFDQSKSAAIQAIANDLKRKIG